MIEIFAVGGYNDIGKNCTAIKVDDEIVIVDLGIHLENYIKLTEDDDLIKINPKNLMKAGAVPDISVLNKLKESIKAVVISHAHLDHLGAVPYLADDLKVPIFGTPFTIEVIKNILKEDRIKIESELRTLAPNSRCKITDNIELELVHITHSTPQTALVVLHTKYGSVLYANDFKLDMHPVLGEGPNFKRLKELKGKVKILIMESTYAPDAKKMPSETVAKEMLREVLLETEKNDKLIIVTTFSSHIARLKSVIEFGKKLNRKIVFMGRSLAKYVDAAEKANLVEFSKNIEIKKYGKQIEKFLKKIGNDRKEYLLVMTGHQGEHRSVLSRISRGELNFELVHNDWVVFSCNTIPTPTNIANREMLESELKKLGVRIFKDIHQSGHAAREDLRDFINILEPKSIIPAHGTNEMKEALAELSEEMGYSRGENIFLVSDGNKVVFKNTKNI
ncbi:RNase J family beta-CASP ribonuclease [Candidatus Woesearchaeota archaeon]|nr:RNase J family beta-CASP ribonuclease [Candidatus Woesearchaeota archaeon]